MDISIIIPTIRSEKLIDFQLPSIAKQTFPNDKFETMIIDDHPQSRKEQVESFGKINGLNVKWMRSKRPYYRSNQNIACARNTGLIHAKGELIVFIDDFSCIRPKYLENVWNIYKHTGFTHIGPVISVQYGDDQYSKLIDNLKIRQKDDRTNSSPCPSGWFYTSNASAPLDSIMKVNGFWEMADLTREEDVLMGLALERSGRKFCFVDNPDISVYHMVHGDKLSTSKIVHKKFKDITYDVIGWPTVKIDGRDVRGGGNGGKCGLDTDMDCIQLVTRDMFNTRYPGSWALIEHFRKNQNLIFNKDIGFDLAKERKRLGATLDD